MKLPDVRLDVALVDRDPLRQFHRWLDDAELAKVQEPTAMTLATADDDGRPSARIVLLKGADQRGFVFYTDTRSRKGSDLLANPRAALVFWWKELERQVRVSGAVTPVDGAEADTYFWSRQEGSRVSAWASEQSSVLSGREVLERRWEEAARRFTRADIPRPAYWGGYRVVPEEYEFWHRRPNRLHDRVRYRREKGAWTIERLSP